MIDALQVTFVMSLVVALLISFEVYLEKRKGV
jgi:hypothetical protein